MKRIVLIIFTVVCLLVMLATIILWALPPNVSRQIAHFTMGTGPAGMPYDYQIYYFDGRFCYQVGWSDTKFVPAPLPGSWWNWDRWGFGMKLSQSSNIGFSPRSRAPLIVTYFRQIYVPVWFVGSLFGMLAGLVIWRLRRRPPDPGMCTKCGYDLRVSSERCPECGTAIEQPALVA